MNRSIHLIVLLVCLLTAPLLTLAQTPEEELICEAFADSPADARVSYYMGEGAGYLASGQYASAIDSYSCALKLNEDYLGAYIQRAVAYTQRQDYQKAVEDYTAAIALDANFVAAYNNRGVVQAAMQEYDEAMADFNQVIQKDANYVMAYNNRAVVQAVLGNYTEAIADLEQAIKLSAIDTVVADLTNPERAADAPYPEYNPDDAQSYALLGIIYSAYALDNYDKYLLLRGGSSDQRIQSAAGSLQSRFSFELRLDDGTWLLRAAFTPAGEEVTE